MELYPIPDIFLFEGHRRIPPSFVLRNNVPRLTFRMARLSSAYSSHQPSVSLNPTIVSLLAYDLKNGLYFYHIHIPSPESAIAETALHVVLAATCSLSPANPQPGTSRGFVSAMCLGPQGKRGMWAERDRGSTKRNVMVFNSSCISATQASHREIDADGEMQDGLVVANVEGVSIVPTMDGRSVYEVVSYDLRGRCYDLIV